jgi:S-DNA-T family DNA segregation ATPase FtsK/SpoIIIE
LFYLGHRFGGKMMFQPSGNPPKVGTEFHHLADHFAFIAKQEPRFQALFEPEADQLNVDAIAQQLQQLFYELAFYPHLQALANRSRESTSAFSSLGRIKRTNPALG